MAPKVFVKLFAICLIVTISICSCSQKKNEPVADYNDTTVTVYGPYKVVKLPVKKGTRIGNPIQLSSGPGDLIFAANQSGEVYTLHDSDGDGYEDSTALYCNVKDYTLRSPVGFTFKEDTVFIGTSQQVRAFTDLNKDGRADSSWIFF